jgi:hypothetical protein
LPDRVPEFVFGIIPKPATKGSDEESDESDEDDEFDE